MIYNELDLIILKSLITNKKHAIDFVSDNSDAKLFQPETWNFANIVTSYVRVNKELPTLRVITEKLAKGNNDKLIENIKILWEEVNKVQYDDKEYKHDLEKIKKRYAEKQISLVKDAFTKFEPGSMDINRAISEMQKTVQNIKSLNQTKAYEKKTLQEFLPTFRDEYNAKMERPELSQGILTGYSFLDHVTNGLSPAQMLLIGAESGGGKSMLLLNMAIQMWLQKNTIDTPEDQFTKGHNVLFFSLEMPYRSCLNRLLARLSNNPTKAIKSASLNSEEAVRLKQALNFIKKYPNQFEIVDVPRGVTIDVIERIYEESLEKYKPEIVVVDYLGLMENDGAEKEDWLKLGFIAGKLHEFCRVHQCVMLSAVQLNRSKSGSKDLEDKVGLHRVGRSALILTHADIAIQINKRQNELSFPDLEYHLIKARDGELGKGRMIKNLKNSTLLDIKSEDQEINDMFSNIDDISKSLEKLDI